MASYRSTCRSCGGQLYVVSGKFETSPMPLRHDGFSFSEAKQVVTENEVVHCSTCDSTLSLAECALQCPDCADKGWDHFDANHGRKIQRCDRCNRLSDDDAALTAHEAECGCGWVHDWFRHLYEVTITVVASAPPDQGAMVRRALDQYVRSHLRGVVTDVPGGGIMQVASAAASSVKLRDGHPSKRLLVELGIIDGD